MISIIIDRGETGASRYLGKLATAVFRPLAIEGLHFKNYKLWSKYAYF